MIAHAAKRVAGTHRLVSTQGMIPQLRRRPGLRSWRVMHGGTWYERYEDLPAEVRPCYGLGLGCASPHQLGRSASLTLLSPDLPFSRDLIPGPTPTPQPQP